MFSLELWSSNLLFCLLIFFSVKLVISIRHWYRANHLLWRFTFNSWVQLTYILFVFLYLVLRVVINVLFKLLNLILNKLTILWTNKGTQAIIQLLSVHVFRFSILKQSRTWLVLKEIIILEDIKQLWREVMFVGHISFDWKRIIVVVEFVLKIIHSVQYKLII